MDSKNTVLAACQNPGLPLLAAASTRLPRSSGRPGTHGAAGAQVATPPRPHPLRLSGAFLPEPVVAEAILPLPEG